MDKHDKQQSEAKIMVVTGASSGVGQALALHFSQAGYRVCTLARNKDKLDSLVKERPGNIFAYPADIADKDAVASAFEAILSDHPHIDVLINNASVFNSCNFSDEGFANIDRLVDTNLKGTMYSTRLALPSMIARKSGHIINISSVSGIHGIPQQAIYGATKFAVNGFSDIIGYELREHGILVTAICPGGIDTPLWNDKHNPYPGNRDHLITAEEICEQVAFILSQPKSTLYKKLVMFPVSEWH